MEMGYRVKTKIFEGPLELLLSLIEKRKLHISDISLAAVTDDFLAHLEAKGIWPVAESASFISVASTLLLIKSRALLPALSLTEEEKGDMEDLEKRLNLYKLFRTLASRLRSQFGKHSLHVRSTPLKENPVFSPDKGCTPSLLHAHITAVLASLPSKERAPSATLERVVSLEETIDRLSERVMRTLSLSFREFSQEGENTRSGERKQRLSLIVSFLAVLELIKRGALEAEQDAPFGDITMRTERLGTPRYS